MDFEGPQTLVNVLQPNKKMVIPLEPHYVVAMNSAALGHDAAPGRTTLYCEFRGTTVALCTLEAGKCEQWMMTQIFMANDKEVTFTCKGPNAIHLVAVVETRDDDDEEESDDEEDDSEKLRQMMMDMSPETLENTMLNEMGGCQDSSCEDSECEDSDCDDKEPSTIEELQSEDNEPEPVPTLVVKKETPKKGKKVVEGKAEKKKTPEKGLKKETPKKETESKKRAPTTPEAESLPVPKKAKSVRVSNGVSIEDIAVGKGPVTKKGKRVKILYVGKLDNGRQFDSCKNRNAPFAFRYGVGEVVKGMDVGLEGMRVGGKRRITIPSKMGYGKQGAPPSIPKNATLVFDMELLSA